MSLENETVVDKAGLIPEVQKLLALKARYCSSTCLDRGDKFEVIHHFQLEDSVEFTKHIRISIDKEDTLPSISSIYLAAVLCENEMQDHFSIKLSGLALDFKKRFLRAKESPEYQLIKQKKEQDKGNPRPPSPLSGEVEEASP
jgi:Respiratory-chain NADH dehydrogenase, 30 Kd subunit.